MGEGDGVGATPDAGVGPAVAARAASTSAEAAEGAVAPDADASGVAVGPDGGQKSDWPCRGGFRQTLGPFGQVWGSFRIFELYICLPGLTLRYFKAKNSYNALT